jgi:PAS domain S-box-containing protein
LVLIVNDLEIDIRNEEAGYAQDLLAEVEKNTYTGSLQWIPGSSSILFSKGLCCLFRIDPAAPGLRDFTGAVHPEDRRLVDSAVDSILSGEAVAPLLFRIRRMDGAERILKAIPVIYPGSPGKVIATFQDLTGTTAREEDPERVELLEKEHKAHRETQNELMKFNAIIDSTHEAIISMDIHTGRILTWNLAAEKLYGYSRREAVGQSIHIIVPDDQRQLLVSSIESLLKGQNVYKLRTERLRKNGQRLLIQMNIFPIRSQDGTIIACYAVARDITDKVMAEEKLRHHESLLKQAEALSHIGSWEYSFSTGEFSCSDELFRLHGYIPGEITIDRKFFTEATHPEDVQSFKAILSNLRSLRGTFTISRRIIRKDGEIRYLLTRGRVLTGQGQIPLKVYGTCQDLTEAKEAEEKVLKSEAQLKTVQEIALVGSYEWNALTRKRRWSEETFKIFDLPVSEEPAEDRIVTRIHPEDRERVSGVFAGRVKGNTYETEFRLIRPSGGLKYLLSKGRIRRNKAGEVTGLIGMIQDITERKEAEAQILSQKEFLEGLLDNSVDGILAFDKDLVITAWNKAMEEANGLNRTDVVGKSLFDVFPAYRDSEEGEFAYKVLRGEKVFLYRKPYRSLREGYYEANVVPLLNERKEVTGGLCIMRDVTERIRLEEEALQLKLSQQKDILNVILHTQEEERQRISEALHNGVGQLLYAIRLNLQAEGNERVSSLIEDAIRETRSISYELMPNILKDFGLRVAVDEMCQKLSSTNFRIQYDFLGNDRRLGNVTEIAVYRIVQELVNNIVKHSGASEAYVRIMSKENRIVLNIQDNGKGFRPADVKTIKGIGLRSIYNRISLLNGTIKVDSGPGKGTEIRIEIPIS